MRIRTRLINVLWINLLVLAPAYLVWHEQWLAAGCSWVIGWVGVPILSFIFDRPEYIKMVRLGEGENIEDLEGEYHNGRDTL
jgi:hypothetical protein